MTEWRIAAVATAIVIATASTGATQTYPNRVIKAVVPYTAGGPIDVVSRIITKRLGEVLGYPIIIENRPGASGMIGNKVVAAAEPDGYTLLFGNTSTLVVFPAVSHTRDFDVLTRLAPVARLIQGYEVMVVDPAGPAKTLPAFIAYAKAHPGTLNYGSVGFGNLTQVAGVLPLAREGKIRPLAIASATRDPKAPDIPTFMEEGVPDFVVGTFTGVMVPAGTPP